MTDEQVPATAAAKSDGGQPRRRWRMWLWLILVPSLALNMIVVGALAGASLSWRYMTAFDGPPGADAGLVGFIQSLSPERRKEARQLVRSKSDVIAPLRQEARRSRRAVAGAFIADPFDAAGFRAAQERVIAAEMALRRAQIDIQTSLASRMSSSERREFLSWRNQMRKRRGLPPEPLPDGVETEPPKKATTP